MNDETKIPTIHIYKSMHSGFFNANLTPAAGRAFVIAEANSEEDCTHELRKLYWALGKYFKIEPKI